MKKVFAIALSLMIIQSCSLTSRIKSQRLDSSNELIQTNSIDVYIRTLPQYEQLIEFVLIQELGKEFSKRNIRLDIAEVSTKKKGERSDSIKFSIDEFGAPFAFTVEQITAGMESELMYVPNFYDPSLSHYTSVTQFQSEFKLELIDKRVDRLIWQAQVLFTRTPNENMEKDVVELSKLIIDRLIRDGAIYGTPRETNK